MCNTGESREAFDIEILKSFQEKLNSIKSGTSEEAGSSQNNDDDDESSDAWYSLIKLLFENSQKYFGCI